MIKPVTAITNNTEKQEDCRINIIKNGSGNLLKANRNSGVGDLYLPGSKTYIEKAVAEDLVSDFVGVGFNQAVLMARKRNPREITRELKNLANKDLYVVIGNTTSENIGGEPRIILEKAGLHQSVLRNAKEMTTY